MTGDHRVGLLEAFADVLRAEGLIREAKGELDERTARLRRTIAEGETSLSEAWRAVEALMAESGEYEVTLPGGATDYRIGWSKPRESVRVEPDAVPDEFVRLERKPRLKEIGDHLKAIQESGDPLPNWGRLERGKPTLVWATVKKGAA